MKKVISLVIAILMISSFCIFAFASEQTDVCPAYGDVDGNNEVSVVDARLVLRNSIDLETFTEEQIKRGDIDGNGIGVTDARLVLRIAIKLDTAPAHNVVDGACTVCGEVFEVVNPGEPVPKPVTANNQYNMVNGTTYTIKGTMKSASGEVTPILLVRDGNKMYMESSMEGATIGIIVKDNKLYMVTQDHKYSLEFTSAVRSAMGLSDAEYNEMKDISNFSMDVPDLSLATKSTVIEGNNAYTVFTFTATDGSKTVAKMDGDKLISTSTYAANGRLDSITEYETITNTADSSYFELPKSLLNRYTTAVGMVTFMTKIIDISL